VGARPVAAPAEAPRPGDCMSCGLLAPPTHIVPVRKVPMASGRPDEAA
jgi:hypothetical protein